MTLLLPASDHDFLTVFQIVGAFEIASAWKVAISFKREVFTDIGSGTMPVLDDGAFKKACEDLKNSEHKIRAVWAVLWMLLRHWFRSVKYKMCRSASAVFWDFLRWLYKKLVFVLQITPIFTTSLLGLSYLFQWGCDKATFRHSSFVAWYILAKLFCYFLCLGVAALIVRHIRVKAPSSDEVSILSVPPMK